MNVINSNHLQSFIANRSQTIWMIISIIMLTSFPKERNNVRHLPLLGRVLDDKDLQRLLLLQSEQPVGSLHTCRALFLSELCKFICLCNCLVNYCVVLLESISLLINTWLQIICFQVQHKKGKK